MLDKVLLVFVIVCLFVSTAKASEDDNYCPKFNKRQLTALNLAYAEGLPYDLGYTLSAITWQESFVGKNIVKVNNKDGKYGSYGLTHINLETAMYLENMESSWEAKDITIAKLFHPITGDKYSLELSIKKLMSTKTNDWLKWWTSYNGNNPKYGLKILDKVTRLQRCDIFKY